MRAALPLLVVYLGEGHTKQRVLTGKAQFSRLLREDVLPFADCSFPQARVGSNRDRTTAAADGRGPNPTRLVYLSGDAPDLSTTALKGGKTEHPKSAAAVVKSGSESLTVVSARLTEW